MNRLVFRSVIIYIMCFECLRIDHSVTEHAINFVHPYNNYIMYIHILTIPLLSVHACKMQIWSFKKSLSEYYSEFPVK